MVRTPPSAITFAQRQVSHADLKAQIKSIIGDRPPYAYAFRGYKVAKEPAHKKRVSDFAAFETGLERVCKDAKESLNRAGQREAAIVKEFLRRAHHYSRDVTASLALPPDTDWIEWLALMQHHGAPTRLLDWTYSLQVGLYFAWKHARRDQSKHDKGQSDLAIWMINTKWCWKAAMKACTEKGIDMSGLASRPIRVTDRPAAYRDLFSGALPPSVWPVNPFRLNERLTIQRGVFLMAADVTKTLAENLCGLEGYDDEANLVCLRIKGRETDAVYDSLREANITEATLFPGLDGFARSLWPRARSLDIENLKTLDDI